MKDQFKVEETIEKDGEVLFTILSEKDIDYLFLGNDDTEDLLDYTYGSYKRMYNTPEDWLKSVWELENARCDEIQQKIDSLQEEMDRREKIIVVMEKVLP